MITHEKAEDILRRAIAIADTRKKRPPKITFSASAYTFRMGHDIITMMAATPPDFVPHFGSREEVYDLASKLVRGELDQLVLDIFNENKEWANGCCAE